MMLRYLHQVFFITLFLLSTFKLFGQGYLKTQGKFIINEKGERIILRGMGLGGWMLQEGYMFQLANLGQQYRILAAIADVTDSNYAQYFHRTWLATHTTKQDIDALARAGFNSIRLPFHYNLYTLPVEEEPVPGENTWLEQGFAMTDSLLSWCKANSMYLILDLHAAPGGQGNDLNISDRDPAKPSLWDSEANQQKTIALWRKLAERYANEPWIGAYDIINEPNWGFEDPEDTRGTKENKNIPLKKLLMEISEAIRKVDKNHIIIIEGNAFGNNYNGILPPWDDNMVLSFHKYGNFADQASIQKFLDLREQHEIPLWLGESGENSNTWFTNTIELVEKKQIGWAWWQAKKIGINQPFEIKVPKDYSLLLDYWSQKGPKPSFAKAKEILDDFLENIRYENNLAHRDVLDALFRQVNSYEAIPFNTHVIDKNSTILAVDYDLGRNNVAYFDRDTASYHYTPGVNTQGNRGRKYRNDGVDIQVDEQGNPYIFHTEAGEWLQYTVQAKKGNYIVQVEAEGNGQLALSVNGQLETKAAENGYFPIALKEGMNTIRLEVRQGNPLLRKLSFQRQR